MNAQDLIDAENEIASLWNDGQLPFLIHLEGSTDLSYEEWLVDFFHANIKPTDYVFASHRCHLQALLHGMSRSTLVSEVMRGRSMFLYMQRFICSAIVASTPGIAVGMAMSIKRRGGTERCWSFIGDSGEHEGHFYEAVRFAHDRELPVTFIVLDNNSSCGVTKEQRQVKPWAWPDNVVRFEYISRWPHAGTFEKMTLKRTTP